MDMKKELTELLNDALVLEYSDVFLYPREAKTIEDKEISEKFDRFGLMEVRHADIISMKLLELGEKPAWNFRLLKGSASLEDMVKYHLGKEKEMISAYSECIEATDDDNFKIVLRGIKADEELHLEFIEAILKKFNW